ncbi:MAG: hypothetical protein AAF667_05955 [Pseudomonadota bacterium]
MRRCVAFRTSHLKAAFLGVDALRRGLPKIRVLVSEIGQNILSFNMSVYEALLSPVSSVVIVQREGSFELFFDALVKLAFCLFQLIRTGFFDGHRSTHGFGSQLLVLSFEVFLALNKCAEIWRQERQTGLFYFFGDGLKVGNHIFIVEKRTKQNPIRDFPISKNFGNPLFVIFTNFRKSRAPLDFILLAALATSDGSSGA